MHPNSTILFEEYAVPLFSAGMRVLEIGPDAFPSTYRSLVRIEDLEWETLDINDSSELTYRKTSAYSFPIPDNEFDIVLSGQVIEHVRHIWRWMPELARVTKAGGLVITINPVSWPYHEAPIDCWRIFPEGMRALCEDSGLNVETSFWGSLELPNARNVIPGRSLIYQPRFPRRLSPLFRRLGARVEKAFDTITIARKPSILA